MFARLFSVEGQIDRIPTPRNTAANGPAHVHAIGEILDVAPASEPQAHLAEEARRDLLQCGEVIVWHVRQVHRLQTLLRAGAPYVFAFAIRRGSFACRLREQSLGTGLRP